MGTWSICAQQASPNAVKSYARALALWWQYLDAFGLRWDAVTLENFGVFLTWLRTGDGPEVVLLPRRAESIGTAAEALAESCRCRPSTLVKSCWISWCMLACARTARRIS